jgi:hypothetical protein
MIARLYYHSKDSSGTPATGHTQAGPLKRIVQGKQNKENLDNRAQHSLIVTKVQSTVHPNGKATAECLCVLSCSVRLINNAYAFFVISISATKRYYTSQLRIMIRPSSTLPLDTSNASMHACIHPSVAIPFRRHLTLFVGTTLSPSMFPFSLFFSSFLHTA